MKERAMQLKDIFKLASEDGSAVVIPIRMRNGKISKEDRGLFELLSFTGESDKPIFKVVEVTEEKISLEISSDGVSNMVKEITKWESDMY